MPNTMPDMVSRPAVVKKSLLGCEWSRKVQKLKTTKFQNQAVPKPGGAARGGVDGGLTSGCCYSSMVGDRFKLNCIVVHENGADE